jgi:hypothetical protein
MNNENNQRELYNKPTSYKKYDVNDVDYLNRNKDRYSSLYLYSKLKKKNVSMPRAGKRDVNEQYLDSIEKRNIYMPRVGRGRGFDWLTGVISFY